MTLTPRIARYDQVLLDLDGCLWVGDEALEGAPEAVAALRDAGKAVAFLTNDVRHAPEEFVRKLWRLGFQAALSEVVTVGATIQYLLTERNGGAAFVVGTQALVDHVAEAGMRIVNRTEFASRADVVVVGAHEALTYEELRIAAQAVIRGAEWGARRPDLPDARRAVARHGSGAGRGREAAGRKADRVAASRSRRCTRPRATGSARAAASRWATGSRSTCSARAAPGWTPRSCSRAAPPASRPRPREPKPTTVAGVARGAGASGQPTPPWTATSA